MSYSPRIETFLNSGLVFEEVPFVCGFAASPVPAQGGGRGDSAHDKYKRLLLCEPFLCEFQGSFSSTLALTSGTVKAGNVKCDV